MSGGAGETGGEARPVLRNTAVLAAARILERIAGALVVLLIAHRLGASDLGLYVGAMGFFALIAIGGELGITTFLVREIAKDPSCTGPYLVHLSVLTAAFSAAAAAAAFGLLPLLGFEPDMREAIAIVLIAVPPAALNAVQRGVFLAYRRTEFEVAVTFVGGVLNVGASAALLANGYGVEGVLVAFVLVQYLSTATYYVLVRRYIVPIRWAFERATARHVLREIRPFAGSSIVAAAFSRPEVIILSAIGTPAQVGYYGAALKVMEFGTLVPQLFMMNVYPVLARAFQRRDGRAQRIQDRAFKFLMIASLPLAALMFAVADPLIDLLYGDGFGEAARLLRILAPGILLACGFSVLWRVLSARGEQGTVLKVQVVTTALELGLGVALIAAFADVGAAVNAVLSGFVLATLRRHDGVAGTALVARRPGGRRRRLRVLGGAGAGRAGRVGRARRRRLRSPGVGAAGAFARRHRHAPRPPAGALRLSRGRRRRAVRGRPRAAPASGRPRRVVAPPKTKGDGAIRHARGRGHRVSGRGGRGARLPALRPGPLPSPPHLVAPVPALVPEHEGRRRLGCADLEGPLLARHGGVVAVGRLSPSADRTRHTSGRRPCSLSRKVSKSSSSWIGTRGSSRRRARAPACRTGPRAVVKATRNPRSATASTVSQP
jgi:O-antigen/teichoic acid export membrane protein